MTETRAGGRPRILLLSDDDELTGTWARTRQIAGHLAADADVALATLTSLTRLTSLTSGSGGDSGRAHTGGERPVPVQHIGSAGSLNMSEETWQRYFAQRLERLVTSFSPDVLVTDGVFPERVLTRICSTAQTPRVEVVSALERRDSPADAPELRLRVEVADLTPVGAPETARPRRAAGPVAAVDPVIAPAVHHSGGGGDRGRVAVVDVGELSPETAAAVEDAALDWFSQDQRPWQVVVLDSPIGRRPSHGVQIQHGGPEADLLRAAAVAISVPGYRPFHTWTPAAVPTLWLTEPIGAGTSLRGAAQHRRRERLPEHSRAQVRRAEHAQEAGWGLCREVDGAADADRLRALVSHALAQLCEDPATDPMEDMARGEGAAQAAEAIIGVAGHLTINA